MLNKTIDSIIRLDLCPLRVTKQGNDYYEPKLRELGKVEEMFSRNYNIEFNAPEVSAKVRYYKRLIDNAITAELNNYFSKTNSNTLALFYRKSIFGLVQTGLKEIGEIIITNNLDLIAHLHGAGHPGRHEMQCGESNYSFIIDAVDKAGYKGALGLEYRPLLDPMESLKTAKELFGN